MRDARCRRAARGTSNARLPRVRLPPFAAQPCTDAPLACTAARAGPRDSAIAWLGEVRAVPTVYTAARMAADPCFAPRRADARFAAVVRGR